MGACAKVERRMMPGEEAAALGTCDQGKSLIYREGGLANLFAAFEDGHYSDQLMAELIKQFWCSVHRAILAQYELRAYDSTNYWPMNEKQWAQFVPSIGSRKDLSAGLEIVHYKITRIQRYIAEGRLRKLQVEIADIRHFLGLK
jgi:hypothetical protein